ncbi:type IV toxin-antitoxin system AbiEi family antitoxin domain-containing protein [Solirubrobacter phytolaccae]|uniref:Type IV toxin-antitoxin system AbiEi family antitoxin domain-containing protein n=1 Tax=Solirubrobacter phytolaccae TaxID=1404360 RepID=A0A9X3NG79_9ACTN|nr:type IV toxin-antitoxin system AbiEi family antitoxin domain-containing protein [Solirubrobacter phytolaccae]
MVDKRFEKRRFGGPPPGPDGEIARIAARQYGIVTTAQLSQAGLDSAAIVRRVRAGRLHRVGRGVYAVGHTALSEEGTWLAEVFKAGEGAALGYFAAAKLYGAWRYRVSLIDVVVPRERRVRTNARLHRCRNLDPRDVTVFKGIPVTTFARTAVDLTDELTKWELANLLHEADWRKRLSIPATREAMARANGRRHLKRLEQAIALHESGSAGTKSRDELRFLIGFDRANLPEPKVNTHLAGHEVDFHWPELQLAIELDGPGHDRERTQKEDERKEAAWRADGFEVLRFKETQLRAATHAVAARGLASATAPLSRA